MCFGSQEASITKELPRSLEDLYRFQALPRFFAWNAIRTHESKAYIRVFVLLSFMLEMACHYGPDVKLNDPLITPEHSQ